MLRALLAAVLGLSLATALPAQTPAPPPNPSTTQTTPETPSSIDAPAAPAADTGRVAVPPPSEKAVRYHRSGNVLWVIGTLWGLLVPAVILFSGLSAKIRDRARRIGRGGWFLTLVLYGAAYTLLTFAVDLPLAYYTGFVREHAYGLSNQSAGAWWGDTFKALAIGIVGLALTLWIPYLLLRKSPRRWWLYTSLALVPLVVFFIWLAPVVIDPVFDRFGPMKDRALEARILALADRAGIEGGRVYEVAKREDTNAVNAYVTGFGPSKRIVLWDTLLEKMDERETLFVMGHEMGHYVLRHVVWTLALAVIGIFASFWAVHAGAGWLIGKYRHRFGFDTLADPASYPLLILITSVVGLLATPPLLAFARHLEHEADRFGLELTRDNHAAARAFVKLQQENLAVPYPGPVYTFFQESHPSLGHRVEFANEYRPWETGQPLKYGDKFE
ncbi:MAG TPA: M48 family metallopeptidase [Longimicrobium sp.]|nr:M48 family metallopeptidase [Longimicrobium sp.]